MSGEVQLRLRDDGVAPDIIKNDGVYSAYYIPRTESNQTRYSLVCKASGNDDTLIVDNNPNQGKSLPSRPSLSAPICCGSEAVKVFYIFFDKLWNSILFRTTLQLKLLASLKDQSQEE